MEKQKKTYSGPATEFTDPDEAKKIRTRELKAQKELEWNADRDTEAICETYFEYLWSSSLTTKHLIKTEKQKTAIVNEERQKELEY